MVRQILYPQPDPFESGMLDVGEGHEIYWEQCGGPKGVPVLFLHGGPGAGCSSGHRRFFDPKFYRAVLFDQRGAGRSRPTGGLQGNTTQNLIADIELLREKLGIKKWIVFGGSWGSTLALAYAQTHPARVSGLVLRGIFLGAQAEVDWFMNDMGNFFPDAYESFVEFLPPEERGDLLGNYYKHMCDPDPVIHLPAARSWAKYEAACCVLIPNAGMLDELDDPVAALGLGRLEAHYFVNKLFLETAPLLDNMDKIAHIPGVIVQGRYDVICPPSTAYKLASHWPKVELIVVNDAGHSATESGITAELVKAMERFKGLFH